MRHLIRGLLVALCCAGFASAETLRIGVNTPVGDSPDYHSLMAFKTYVEFNSGGRLQLQVFAGGQLGSERQMTEQVRDGALDLAVVADGNMTGFYPKLQVFAIPYLFPSSPVAWDVLRGPFASRMKDDIHKVTGFYVLDMYENGFRDFTNNKHPIRNPEDLKGLKMRTMESPVFVIMMQALGAAATPIGTDQLIMSLQQNVVDGQENAPSTVFEFGIADVQKFMSTDEHVFSAVVAIVAKDSFENLAPDLQRILQEGAIVMGNLNNAEKAMRKSQHIDLIRKRGVQVYLTSPAEKAAFKAVAQPPVLAYIQKQVGQELVDALLADEKRAEVEVYGK